MYARCRIEVRNLKGEYDQPYTLPAIDVLMAIQLLMAMWQFEELSLVRAILDHYRQLVDVLSTAPSVAIPERLVELRQTIQVLEAIKEAYDSAEDKEAQWQIQEIGFPMEWEPVVLEYFKKVYQKGRHFSGIRYCETTGDEVIARQLVRYKPGIIGFYPDGKES